MIVVLKIIINAFSKLYFVNLPFYALKIHQYQGSDTFVIFTTFFPLKNLFWIFFVGKNLKNCIFHDGV
jgi:hypothetical protein